MYNSRDQEPLTHKPDLTGMVVGDFFYFCDFCGHQRPKGAVSSGRECPACGRGQMFVCRVTALDIFHRDRKASPENFDEAAEKLLAASKSWKVVHTEIFPLTSDAKIA